MHSEVTHASGSVVSTTLHSLVGVQGERPFYARRVAKPYILQIGPLQMTNSTALVYNGNFRVLLGRDTIRRFGINTRWSTQGPDRWTLSHNGQELPLAVRTDPQN